MCPHMHPQASVPYLMSHLQVFDWLEVLRVKSFIDYIESLIIEFEIFFLLLVMDPSYQAL